MKTKIIAFLASIAALLSAGCYQYGPQQVEKATVISTHYSPEQSGSGTGYNYGEHGGLTYTSVTLDAVWAVEFRCQHGHFVTKVSREMWNQLTNGMPVTLVYREATRDGQHVKYKLDSIQLIR